MTVAWGMNHGVQKDVCCGISTARRGGFRGDTGAGSGTGGRAERCRYGAAGAAGRALFPGDSTKVPAGETQLM